MFSTIKATKILSEKDNEKRLAMIREMMTPEEIDELLKEWHSIVEKEKSKLAK